jgi:hypothetical protein
MYKTFLCIHVSCFFFADTFRDSCKVCMHKAAAAAAAAAAALVEKVEV